MERFHNLTELLAIDRAAHAYFDGQIGRAHV